MRFIIGILLLTISSALFAILLAEKTPWIFVTYPLFVIGYALIYSKFCEMKEDIAWLEKKLNEFIKKENEHE